jgi:endo-1,4-beta-xylanase
MRAIAPGRVWLACTAAVLVAAQPAGARELPGSARTLRPGKPATVQAPLRTARGVQLTIRPRGCGRRAHLIATSGSAARQVFRVRAATLQWPIALPAGVATLGLRVQGPAGCRVALQRVVLDEVVVLGTAVMDNHFDEPAYARAAERFTGVTPENAMKMERIQPRRGQYAFSAGDRVVAFAQAHGQEVHGHPLVWGDQLPLWLLAPALGLSPTRDEVRTILRNHIQAVVGHYKGKVASWDVVNEAVAADGTLRHNLWLDRIGPEYIEDAFRWAHAADPSAKLYYNEVDIERASPRMIGVLAMLRDLRERGVPIDGVGMQGHLRLLRQPPTAGQVSAAMADFADAGFDVAVSELDVSTDGLRRPGTAARQAAVFRGVADACQAQLRCKRVTVWGVSDAFSWEGRTNAPLPIDASYRPKAAWCGLVRVLQQRAC